MTSLPEVPAEVLAAFNARQPTVVVQTPIATVWKVDTDGRPSALKLYDGGDMQDEAPGIALLDAMRGSSAVRIFDQRRGAILMEWLDGPPLSALCRQNRDDDASAVIAQTAQVIWKTAPPAGLRALEVQLRDLLLFDPGDDWQTDVQGMFANAKAVAKRLLRTAPTPAPLHGDLHHDNILQTARGYVAIDAKGLIGDPAYDLANAFKNPVGAADIYSSSRRITEMANIFTHTTGQPPDRILGWAFAHCAASILWDNGGADHPLIQQLGRLQAAYQAIS